MTRDLRVLLVALACLCPVYVWQGRVNRQIGRRLAEEGNPSGLQSPKELSVWRRDWRAYESIENADLLRLITLSYRLNLAVTLISVIALAAYFYSLLHD